MNRRKRVKRRLVGDQKSPSQGATTEKQALRERRLKRYQKRRSVLKGAQLKSGSASSERRKMMRSQGTPATVLGETQAKRRRQRQVTKAGQKQQRRRSPSTGSAPRLQRRVVRRRQNSSIQLVKLLISGVGVALISGFAIAMMHPEPSGNSVASSDNSQLQFQEEVSPEPVSAEQELAPATDNYEKPGKELRQLKQELRNLVEQQPDLTAGLFFLNPETQEYVTYQGADSFPAASMIKLPVLIAFFQDVDAGKIQLDEMLVMRPELIASEAGAMQYDEPNSEYEALQTADWMITISDNTATNMIIDRLGGKDKLNQRFQEWGLTQTKINQPLPDLEGTNTMSPKDLAILMAKVSQGEILTPHSRDRALEILRNTVTRTLLPAGVGDENAIVAHKTGDIGMAVGDAGLVDMPNGQRFVASVVVKRPHNDPRAQELIRAITKMSYQAFSERPVPRPPSTSNAPAASAEVSPSDPSQTATPPPQTNDDVPSN